MAALTEHSTLPLPAFDSAVKLLIVVAPYYRAIADDLIAGARAAAERAGATVDLIEVPCGTNPLGVKGAGEAGAVGSPPAVINAIVDALRGTGVTSIDMPATPEKVWRAIHEARAA